MNVLHIARLCTARVYKQVLAQQGAGWSVTLMAGQTAHVDLHRMVERQMGWCNGHALQAVSGFDVVVLHTTISTYSDALDLILPQADRHIWDCHDYVNHHPEYYRGFDAVTCPSAGMAKHFDNGVVVYSKVPEAIWPEWSEQCIDAVVFEGTMGNGEAWGDYSGLEQRLQRPVFFYPSGEGVGHEGCKLMQRLPYKRLLSALSQYSAGYAGAANEGVSIHDCVTNKFWEYVAAGLPVLTYNSDEMTELAEQYGVYELWDRGSVRSHIKACLSLTMEAELDKMKEAYEYTKP